MSLRTHQLTVIIALILGMVADSAVAGAWGEGSFENDDAIDWVTTCTSSKSISPVRDALEGALGGKYLQASDGSSAVAAAEVVAAARGKPNPTLPAGLAAWLKQQPARALSDLTPLATRALTRVRDPKVSELRQLWDEGNSARWLALIDDLESRLR